jgi:hypothetical protein
VPRIINSSKSVPSDAYSQSFCFVLFCFVLFCLIRSGYSRYPYEPSLESNLSRTDSKTNTPESYKTRGEVPNASDGQPDEASYTAHGERGQISLTTECYDSGVSGMDRTERFGHTVVG